MLGLFGTLNMGTRSLAAQQLGTQVAGNNLANVNTPGYARQRLQIQTGITVPSTLGPLGTGADGVGIKQLRDVVLDRQIISEASVEGQLKARQQGLQYVQASIGQRIDSSGTGTQHGIAEEMSELFAAFQSVSSSPTERQVLILKAQNLAAQFNQVSTRLDNVESGLNESINVDVKQANLILTDIAKLNSEIQKTERSGTGQANDLRDVRQKRMEELAGIVKFTSTETPDGALDITIDGQTMVSGAVLLDSLQTYDSGGGKLLLRTATGQANLEPGGGSLHGNIDIRDTSLAAMQRDIDLLASTLVTQVNAAHSGGFSLSGSTGADFFTGSDAGSIRVNAAIAADPRLVQASDTAGANGNNRVMLRLAQLASEPQPALNNQTFASYYNQSIARMGQELDSTNTQISNQQIVQTMLTSQRDSVMGVSVDEEMTDLIKYQKAFQASAKLINTVDEMLEIVMSLKR
jgi:flagellar hook-associated protein 1 FlgK